MISLLTTLLISPTANALFDSANDRGVKRLVQKDGAGAYREFLSALGADPLNLAVQLNLGLTFEVNEEWDKAAQAYRGALTLIPEKDADRWRVYFNLGNVLAKAKKIPEALQAYQSALELEPESKEVKTNIELLWQGGGGGGGSDAKEQKDEQNKDQKDKPDNQKQREDSLKQPDKPEPKDQPKPFESKELSADDVKRILDEIKNQEQSIRAQEYEKGAKESARGGKDW